MYTAFCIDLEKMVVEPKKLIDNKILSVASL